MYHKLLLSIVVITGMLTSSAYAGVGGSDLGSSCTANSGCVSGCIEGATPYCSISYGQSSGICLCKAAR